MSKQEDIKELQEDIEAIRADIKELQEVLEARTEELVQRAYGVLANLTKINTP